MLHKRRTEAALRDHRPDGRTMTGACLSVR
jgi:hypothetical protein